MTDIKAGYDNSRLYSKTYLQSKNIFSMKRVFFVMLSACFMTTVHAQNDKDAVIKAATNYIDIFYFGDTVKLHESIAENVVKYGYYIPKNKTVYEGEPMSFKEMLEYAIKVKRKGASPNVEKFPKKVEVFDILDKTASAKITAWWGTDYLILVKNEGKWQISNIVWQSPPPVAK